MVCCCLISFVKVNRVVSVDSVHSVVVVSVRVSIKSCLVMVLLSVVL